MRLMVVRSCEVMDDEPRRWFINNEAAQHAIDTWTVGDDLHLGPNLDRYMYAVIEARTVMKLGLPSSGDGPEDVFGEIRWQEMVWRQAFNAALAGLTSPEDDQCGIGDQSTLVRYVTENSAAVADGALVEWKKRWQR
jgi:hypothetical protein